MHYRFIPSNYKEALRDKARLNICMAKDLSESFGGSKADYLKGLNRKLRLKIAMDYSSDAQTFAMVA